MNDNGWGLSCKGSIYNALFINISRYVFSEYKGKTRNELFKDIADKIYSLYGENVYVSFHSLLGKGQYNIVSKISINSNYYALRINKRLKTINDCSSISKVIIRGDNWIITEIYYSLKDIMCHLIDQQQQQQQSNELINKIIALYAKSMFNTIETLHKLNYGVYDWKLSNCGLKLTDNKVVIVLTDIDLSPFNKPHKYYHSYIDYNNFHIHDMNLLDYEIALKEIYDVSNWSTTSKNYQSAKSCYTDINTMIDYFNKYELPVNNIINNVNIFPYIHKSKNDSIDTLSQKDINLLVDIINIINQELAEKEKQRIHKLYPPIKDFDKLLIKLPLIRILPPLITTN